MEESLSFSGIFKVPTGAVYKGLLQPSPPFGLCSELSSLSSPAIFYLRALGPPPSLDLEGAEDKILGFSFRPFILVSTGVWRSFLAVHQLWPDLGLTIFCPLCLSLCPTSCTYCNFGLIISVYLSHSRTHFII